MKTLNPSRVPPKTRFAKLDFSEHDDPDFSTSGDPFIDDKGIPRMRQEDDKEDFRHFENFVDDDTPAPEASIPVPTVHHKAQNYVYQVLYILYCLSLLAYIYVRITFTLDAPGLNRIYCTLVAILEIITCPSLLIQGPRFTINYYYY